jgi:hypothetical protein
MKESDPANNDGESFRSGVFAKYIVTQEGVHFRLVMLAKAGIQTDY